MIEILGLWLICGSIMNIMLASVALAHIYEHEKMDEDDYEEMTRYYHLWHVLGLVGIIMFLYAALKELSQVTLHKTKDKISKWKEKK